MTAIRRRKRKMRLFPLQECKETADKWIASGAEVYQQFLCQHCGQKLTMDVPDTFFIEGGCDKCGQLTNITKTGCNYTIIHRI